MTYVLAKSPVRKPINQLKKYKVNGVKKKTLFLQWTFLSKQFTASSGQDT